MRPMWLVRGFSILAAIGFAVIPACKIMPVGWEHSSSRSKKELVCFRGHGNSISSVEFSPDGKLVLSSSLDGTLRLWDAASGLEIKSESENISNGKYAPMPAGAVFSLDGNTVVYIDRHQMIREWDLKVGMVWQALSLSPDSFQGDLVVFSPDAKLLASLGPQNSILIWNVRAGKKWRVLKGHSQQVNAMVFTPGGRLLSGSSDGTMRLWDVENGKELRKSPAQGSSVCSVACSPSGLLALAGEAGGWRIGERGIIRLWDVETGEAIRNLEGHDGPVNSLAFSPDGRRALSGSGFSFPGVPDSASLAAVEDHTMRLWDVATGKELARFQGHSMGVTAVAFSPDGTRALSGSHDTTIRLWALPRETPVDNQ